MGASLNARVLRPVINVNIETRCRDVTGCVESIDGTYGPLLKRRKKRGLGDYQKFYQKPRWAGFATVSYGKLR